MTAINFQKKFEPKIADGSKTKTIRRKRKYPIEKGDRLQLYTGMRTKNCTLIMDAICTSVLPIVIVPNARVVSVNKTTLSEETLERFAKEDGFSNAEEFFQFFKQYPMYILLLEMQVIYWEQV